ncbi:hypothetical protein HDU98_009592, partial [Podochytrium sp. JEL0797]
MQLTDSETTALQAYLSTLLQKICDADPSVLAEYVVALLKHEKSDADLEANCLEQLEEFLKHETKGFVDALFSALATKSFMPATVSIPLPAAPLSPPAKRALHEDDDDDDEDGQRARRRRRFDESQQSNDPQRRDFQQQRQQHPLYHSNNNNNNNAYPAGPMGIHQNAFGGGNVRGGPYQRGPGGPMPQMRRRGRCFDFDSKGYCTRGETCPFDHSPLGMMSGGGPGMGMPGMGMNPPPFMGGPGGGGGNMPPYGMNGGPPPMNGFDPMNDQYAPDMSLSAPPPFGGPSNGPTPNMMFPPHQQQPPSFRGGFRGGRGGGGGGGGGSMRGGFRGNNPMQQPNGFPSRPHRNPINDTIVVQNIPPESCSLDTVNTYFKQFGMITDIQVDVGAKRAVVRYATAGEAKAAYSSPEVIFGNRFVKVFYQDPAVAAAAGVGGGPMGAGPIGPQGGMGAPMQQQGFHAQLPVRPTPPVFVTEQQKQKDAAIHLAKQKESFVQTQMELQKQLFARIEAGGMTVEERREVMASLKSVQEVLKGALEDGVKAAEAAKAVAEERKRKVEEAAAVAAAAAAVKVEVEGSGVVGENGEEDEVAMLERLKAEALAVGVDPTTAVQQHQPILRGGPQMRGRGGYQRGGRGGAVPHFSAPGTRSLDLRPKKLVVLGVQESDKALLMSQLESKGRVVLLQFERERLVLEMAFRHESEKVFQSGLKGANAESLTISWFDVNKDAPLEAAVVQEASGVAQEGVAVKGEEGSAS